jgi:hypothetical protein
MDLKKLIEPNHQECIQLKQPSNERRLMIRTSQKWKNITIGCFFMAFFLLSIHLNMLTIHPKMTNCLQHTN